MRRKKFVEKIRRKKFDEKIRRKNFVEKITIGIHTIDIP